MPIIPRPKHSFHKPGPLSGEIPVSIGTTPTTIDLTGVDFLIGTLTPPPNKKVYCSWGDTVGTSTASIMIDGSKENPAIFDYLDNPIPDSNLTFQGEAEGGSFNYQTAQIILI